ncbi:hypothetical protein [Ignavibacterium sp.]|uniref:hypothetical protein n=1 Tax=Ignavibacterium sp. TaxID=2651167 RepID=UPI00307E9B98
MRFQIHFQWLFLFIKYFNWNVEKNKKLKQERNITFEEVLFSIKEGKILDILEHSNKEKYKDQKLLVVEINNYAYLVPFVGADEEIFLKKIIPSRKATKKYLRKKNEKK